MKHLDRVVSYMKLRPGVWFAAGEHIADSVMRQAGWGAKPAEDALTGHRDKIPTQDQIPDCSRNQRP